MSVPRLDGSNSSDRGKKALPAWLLPLAEELAEPRRPEPAAPLPSPRRPRDWGRVPRALANTAAEAALGLIALRVGLRLFRASAASAFVDLVESLSEPLVEPFGHAFRPLALPFGRPLEPDALLAFGAYLLGWLLLRRLWSRLR